jgi:hypothetical protein
MLGQIIKWLVKGSMDNLGVGMHNTTLYTPCIALVLMTHTCIFVIDHAEHELEEPSALAPIEAGNHEQDHGKPRCI